MPEHGATEKNYMITIEYDGTNYVGWQRQKNGLSIQQALEEAIEKVTGEKVHVQGAGRTDSGVHALAQVANFRTSSHLPAATLLRAINAYLPRDIVVKKIKRVRRDFNAQFDACSKVYRYSILNSPIRSPLRDRQCYHVKQKLNLARMKAALRYLVGTHDFRAFQTEAWRKKNSVRTIKRIDVTRDADMIYITIEADGFLYNMVRSIVGTAIQIGRGKHPPSHMKRVLESRDRKKAGANAPPQGLCLMEVKYESKH